LKRLSDFSVYLAVRLLMAVIQVLPLGLCERFARGLAYLATDVFRIQAELIDENLRRVSEMSRDERQYYSQDV
jgi:lauroyl/myristoyl acyltransferase